MGRLFDTTSKTSTIPKSTSGKGRLFVTPVKKATLGEKVEKVAKGVTKFVGGEKLSEAIGGTIAINKADKRGDTKVVEYLGADLPTNKQTLASIGEVALNVVPFTSGLGAGAKTATKLATSIPRLATEGSIYGASQAGLRSVQEGADVFSPETAKSVAVGGALGGVAGVALGGIGRLFKETPKPIAIPEVVNKIDELADNALSKSTTGIKDKTVKYLKENPQEISNREVKLREVDGKVVIEDGRHTLAAAKETGITPKFVDVTSEYTGKPSEKISGIISQPKVVTIQPINVTPEISNQADIITEQARFKSPNPETFDSGTHKIWAEKILAQPRSHIENVINGIEQPLEGVPKTKYYDVLSDLISKEGDPNKIIELALSKPKEVIKSKAGQELSGLSQIDKDNIVNVISDVVKTKEDKLPNIILKGKEKEIKNIKDKITEVFNSIKQPSREVISDALESLKCK